MKMDRAGSRYIQPTQDVQQRRFPTATRPQQDGEFCLANVEPDAAQSVHFNLTHLVGFGQISNFKHQLGQWT